MINIQVKKSVLSSLAWLASVSSTQYRWEEVKPVTSISNKEEKERNHHQRENI